MFERVLIANRGEIACRVIRTCRRLGIRTIAVYSDVDAHAAHVELADVAYGIGGSTARSSYLDIAKILDAAQRSGAAAIHPGYGFLSENPAFADACREAGRVFVGPSADAMRAMGLKDRAKELMERAGVPVVPGYHGADQEPATLAAAARQIGFPVLIKAVAGGGGKGMRRVDRGDDFLEALAAAKREAESAFGDGRVLVEKYVSRPRHIELQVFGDRHGNALSLFERDCSLQRRHQKVIEEAPAPHMPEALRARLVEIAVRATRAIGYEGAGTIEMIADAEHGLGEGRVYFMEMNTRLQVEHPVTEAITGLDLVEWQLRVAAGERLPLSQAEVPLRGHAIEVRLYAEDPDTGYLPQTGTLSRFSLPSGTEGVRVDAGVREGDTVSVHYDPLLAKLIAHGDTRAIALARLRDALAASQVMGLRTNLALLSRIAQHPAFAAGDVHTAFLDEHAGALLGPDPERDAELAALFAACLWAERVGAPAAHPFDVCDGFRPFAQAEHAFDVRLRGRDTQLRVRNVDPADATAHLSGSVSLGVRLDDGRELLLRHVRQSEHGVSVELSGHMQHATLQRRGDHYTMWSHGRTLEGERLVRDHGASAGQHDKSVVRAPMPGRVIAVHTRQGARVARGDALVRLEAMKMEHTLRAPVAAEVTALSVREGDQVSEGSVLVTLRAEEE